MAKLIYDGKEAVFGRISTVVAKELLKGNSVDLINCEEMIISGDKKTFIDKINKKRTLGDGSGSLKGPKYPRVADRLVKRMIRGMLPRDRMRGQDAFRRLRCYEGDSVLTEDTKKNIIKVEHKKPMKYFTIKEVIKVLK